MTVRDKNLCGRPDSELIGVCADEGRCLITPDFDFADTLTYPPDRYAGIVLLCLSRNPKPGDIDSATETLLDGLNRQEVGEVEKEQGEETKAGIKRAET